MKNNDKTIKILCDNCGKNLLDIQTVETNDKNINVAIVVECGFCGSVSSQYDINKRFFPGAPSDDAVFEIVHSTETSITFRTNPK